MWIQIIDLSVVQSKYVFVSMVTLPISKIKWQCHRAHWKEKKPDEETLIETVIDHDLLLHILIC